jgi:hypothetical protein
MRFSRRTLSIVTVALVLTLLGGGVWWRLRPADANAAAEAGACRGDPDDPNAQVSSVVSGAFSSDIPQPVTGAEVVRDTLWISVNAAGRAEAVRRATLQAQVRASSRRSRFARTPP